MHITDNFGLKRNLGSAIQLNLSYDPPVIVSHFCRHSTITTTGAVEEFQTPRYSVQCKPVTYDFGRILVPPTATGLATLCNTPALR
jgi:hypothetical protein